MQARREQTCDEGEQARAENEKICGDRKINAIPCGGAENVHQDRNCGNYRDNSPYRLKNPMGLKRVIHTAESNREDVFLQSAIWKLGLAGGWATRPLCHLGKNGQLL